MYQIILVDDEPLVIKSLKNRIKWDDFGCQVIGEATNGLAAYDLILQTRPDIVFTDIRMAGISGLELIQKINESDLSVIFIVISGYAEFAYAQKALNQGALGFCLKPFDENEITAVLKKAIAALDRNRSVYEEQLLALLEDDLTQKRTQKNQLLRALGFANQGRQRFITVITLGSMAVQPAENHRFLSLKTGSRKYAYIIELNPEDQTAGSGLRGIPAETDDVGISEIHDTADALEESLDEAGVAASQSFLTGRRGILYFYGAHCPEGFDTALRNLSAALVARNRTAADKSLDQIEAFLLEGACNIRHALKTYNIFLYFHADPHGTLQDNALVSSAQLISQFVDVRGLFAMMKSLLHDEAEYPVAEETRNITFKKVLDYVNQNYSQEISLQSLAQTFLINANYLSQLFSREKGQTFTEYLTGLRMNQAGNRLLATDLPVYRIAEEAGYKDYFHFAKVFKRATGQTPTDYRKIRQA